MAMHRLFVVSLVIIGCLLAFAAPATAQDRPSIAEATQGMEALEGFFPLYWDAADGKVWLEVSRLNEDFLYVNFLPAGLGSNDVGLDRGQIGGTRVVRFERAGNKLLLVAPNLTYRAHTDNPHEVRAVRDAFAESVLFGFEVAAQTDDRFLIDATDFIVRDAHGVVQRLRQRGQGSFRMDGLRSAPYREGTGAFPQNTEMEARVTFVTDQTPGAEVRTTAADAQHVTLRVRHSFIALPDTDGFTPRPHDPRSGYYSFAYEDYAAPVNDPTTQRFISRHRLHCADEPGEDGLCTPEEPIIYYLDPGTPEPVRTALLEGGRWWNEAFEAAGFRDAFDVQLLPEDADPMDLRYHVIQWVHRSTRGWSYGPSVIDPRTGEILKGHVTLGSLRVRHDHRIFEGLLAPYRDDHRAGFTEEEDPMLPAALNRIRQLSAHEIGHTLGLRHNFAASTRDRASVMDYPAPKVTINEDGELSLEEAYATGMGAWDMEAIRFGYAPVPEGRDEQGFLEEILQAKEEAGLLYVSDQDARPAGAAHPQANLWDNGGNMIEALRHEARVRQHALDQFGERVVRTGEPLALMEEHLVPIYLWHRYQVQATAKLLGGVEYDYTVRGDARTLPTPVPAATQQTALNTLLQQVRPEALRLPEQIRTTIPPRPPGYGANRELFERRTGLTFDAHAPAEVVAALVFGQLLQPQRLARIAYQTQFDGGQLSLGALLDGIDGFVWRRAVPDDAYDAGLQRVVQTVWTDALLETAMHDDLAPDVAAEVVQQLRQLHLWLEENIRAAPGRRTVAHRQLLFDRVDRFLFRDLQMAAAPASRPRTPPGSPIGAVGTANATHGRLMQGVITRQTQRRALLQHSHTADIYSCHAELQHP